MTSEVYIVQDTLGPIYRVFRYKKDAVEYIERNQSRNDVEFLELREMPVN